MDPQHFERARERFLAGTRALEDGRCSEAEHELLASLALLPGRASTLVNLGVARLRLGRPQDALAALDEAIAADPDAADAHAHRGEALGRLGRHEQALAAFERLLVLAPGSAEAWFRHGQTLQWLGRPAEALASYRRAVELDPRHVQGWSQLGGLLAEGGQTAAAREAFETALALGADPALHRWFLAALGDGAELPPAAPRSYVEPLFDSYAAEFEQHLIGALRYRAPQQIAALLAEAGGGRGEAALDLGCGTGLLAPVLRPLVQRLDGLDLSRGMLDRARATGLYDELLHADATDFLQSTDRRYALVAAADVFIYLGDLDPVFAGVARVLEPGGRFVFSAERAPDGQGVVLHAGLRYAHGLPYLRALAARHGFALVRLAEAPLREQQGRPVAGLFALLTRPAAGGTPTPGAG